MNYIVNDSNKTIHTDMNLTRIVLKHMQMLLESHRRKCRRTFIVSCGCREMFRELTIEVHPFKLHLFSGRGMNE